MKDQPNPVNLETNKRFKKFRETVFVTQEEAAKFLGIKQSMISRIERGVHILHPDHRKKLITEKSMNPKWYDTGIGNMLLTKEDKKRPTIVDVKDLQADIEQLRSEVTSLRTNMKMMLKMINELQK